MRLLLTTEDIYFDLSGLVLKVLPQFHAESENSSGISGSNSPWDTQPPMGLKVSF